jgi:hypothetical protein
MDLVCILGTHEVKLPGERGKMEGACDVATGYAGPSRGQTSRIGGHMGQTKNALII